MTSRKNYNSIVFLTTLSVYLGLALIGGTPPVLAHAALTRNFDIQNEIEFKDDLDKKPDEELKSINDSLESYFQEVRSFIKDLQKLHSIEKFDSDYDKFVIEKAILVPCDVNGDPIATSKTSKTVDNNWLEPAIINAIYGFEDANSLAECLIANDFSKDKTRNYGIKLNYDKSELKIEISGFKNSPHKVQQLAENFNKVFKTYKIDEEEVIVKKIYENTSIKSENNQVFIVTRLPRGSLDALLAEKDAQ